MSYINSPTQPIKNSEPRGTHRGCLIWMAISRHKRLSPYFVVLNGKSPWKLTTQPQATAKTSWVFRFYRDSFTFSIVLTFKRTLSFVRLLIVCAYSVHTEYGEGKTKQEPHSRRKYFEAGVCPCVCAGVWWAGCNSNKTIPLVFLELRSKHPMLLSSSLTYFYLPFMHVKKEKGFLGVWDCQGCLVTATGSRNQSSQLWATSCLH